MFPQKYKMDHDAEQENGHSSEKSYDVIPQRIIDRYDKRRIRLLIVVRDT